MAVSDHHDRKLMKSWREKVNERDKKVCAKCGKGGVLHCHHYYGKRSRPLRWFVPNGIMLCPSHHKMSSEWSAHETPELFTDWFKAKYPKRAKLLRKMIINVKPFKMTYEEVLEMQEVIDV